eukprot:Blabericola_migrator_1__3147@NODE_191_length_11624_cov_142_842866_g68_i1_p4_GENE_NODE_191_length_11624_cov_142_842866_g68_i1NODE_191_length_11624_cov_142_842866_g68_i1_p4_ORF_typecomplete_len398_score62_88_NODE_191_length_11624_cov_142_842866_g68_i154816674
MRFTPSVLLLSVQAATTPAADETILDSWLCDPAYSCDNSDASYLEQCMTHALPGCRFEKTYDIPAKTYTQVENIKCGQFDNAIVLPPVFSPPFPANHSNFGNITHRLTAPVRLTVHHLDGNYGNSCFYNVYYLGSECRDLNVPRKVGVLWLPYDLFYGWITLNHTYMIPSQMVFGLVSTDKEFCRARRITRIHHDGLQITSRWSSPVDRPPIERYGRFFRAEASWGDADCNIRECMGAVILTPQLIVSCLLKVPSKCRFTVIHEIDGLFGEVDGLGVELTSPFAHLPNGTLYDEAIIERRWFRGGISFAFAAAAPYTCRFTPVTSTSAQDGSPVNLTNVKYTRSEMGARLRVPDGESLLIDAWIGLKSRLNNCGTSLKERGALFKSVKLMYQLKSLT